MGLDHYKSIVSERVSGFMPQPYLFVCWTWNSSNATDLEACE